MFKVVTKNTGEYSEIPQRSPMRWRLLQKVDSTTLVDQTLALKCKDFFNDVVIYKRTGEQFSIYGFNNKVEFTDGGMYTAITNIDAPSFFPNLTTINVYLESKGLPPIAVLESATKDVHILHIPETYWDNTFFISMVSSLIRSCSYGKKGEVTQLCQEEPTLVSYMHKVDPFFNSGFLPKANTILFSNYQYSGKDVKKLVHAGTFSYMHNAGLQSWYHSGALV
jgi:hypothetical protein